MANNITRVLLLRVPLEKDYKHTLFFDSEPKQESYFLSKKVAEGTEFTYQRKDSKIRYPLHIDVLYQIECNYVMYTNPLYPNKWFYAFISKMEYVNECTTDIFIETDVMQTWMFDYRVLPSYVEREHVDDDTPGLHTVPEQLELGEYICNDKIKENGLLDTCIVVGSTVDLNGDLSDESTIENVNGLEYGYVYSGVKYYYFLASGGVNAKLKALAKAGKSDAITCIFMCPYWFLKTSGIEITGVDVDGYVWGSVGNGCEKITKPTDLNGYTPKNKKLLSFPYSYLLMSNNSGGAGIYHYELFNGNVCDFRIMGALTPGFSCRILPLQYKGLPENNEEGLTLGKFPICNWNTDVYTNWLTQNGVNIALSGVSSAGSILGGIGMMFTGAGALAGAGMIGSGLMGVASTAGEVYSHSLQPPQAEGNINSGDVTFSNQNLTFTAYKMSIKEEYAKIIDGIFDMYGYKVNRVKIPNKEHRENYWYTKCIDVCIDGMLPQEDLEKIKQCYNSGITFWKKPEFIKDYSVNNNII